MIYVRSEVMQHDYTMFLLSFIIYMYALPTFLLSKLKQFGRYTYHLTTEISNYEKK